jgi:hypothetical protein
MFITTSMQGSSEGPAATRERVAGGMDPAEETRRMARFRLDDFHTLENTPTSPATLSSKIGRVVLSSTHSQARVESLNPETGEYRVVLQGTLDRETTRFDD